MSIFAPSAWNYLGKTTLGSAGDTLTVSSLPNFKYLLIQVSVISSGNTSAALQFNGDTAANYSQRQTVNDTAGTSTSATTLGTGLGVTITTPWYMVANIVNISTQEKLLTGQVVVDATAGAGTAPTISTFVGKWANTADVISSITATNAGTGNFDVGSEMIVFGAN